MGTVGVPSCEFLVSSFECRVKSFVISTRRAAPTEESAVRSWPEEADSSALHALGMTNIG